jgi:hypothetical protein
MFNSAVEGATHVDNEGLVHEAGTHNTKSKENPPK